MNVFSTDPYLEALARVYFPGRPYRVGYHRTAERVFRLLRIDGGAPITEWPFLDFVEPLPDGPPPGEPVEPLPFVPKAVVKVERVEERLPPVEGYRVMPSPYVDFRLFPAWKDFEAMVGSRVGNLLPDSRRKRKKLERDLGPLKFVFDDRRSEPFDRCVEWKSAQYRASGLQDMFAEPKNVEMFRELWRRGVVVVSTLTAGEALLAVHIGALWEGRCYWWVPAYDVKFQKYGPGRLMLQSLIEESHRLGHREFDFLIGDEDYKWHYATHNRVIGALGVPPLPLVLQREAKAQLKRVLERFPRALEAAKELRRRLQRGP